MEKSGFWVTVTALIFYPLSWMGKTVLHNGDRIRREGGVLLVMNHISHLDPPVDAVFVHRQGRVPRFLAKESLFRVPLFKYLIGGAGSIPVTRRSSGAADSLHAAGAALREGKLVVIYPEGTITRDPDGWPMRARTGVARLALETEAPVIPAARWGTKQIFDGYTKKFRPFPRKRVDIRVGEPVDLSAYRGRPVTNELLREVTDVLMTRVRDLLVEIRQEPAPAEFYAPRRAPAD
ncbi:1-acyl-sn-glycerol-3-phosphate acyltransferase [Actinophytocola xanthii]|uniref:1-acyl-sn-glycerol-3-phosphate acyltransferase n=1 Tax=Actinophytocola xanthii TaxID=1912961 RepID=A0A1Q8CWY2_9PSEU|nr:1-acyl-sn-glycerol-3-phosphate acyltransferase [Actinophytocola xanthii]